MSDTVLRRYGEATTVTFELWNTTGTALKTDAAHASGDTKVMKDEGAEANTTNGFVDEGQTYSIALTATEMQAARVVLIIVDQTSPVWLDKVLRINTYGHPSAQHPEMGIALPNQGTAQAGASGSVTLASGASATDDLYNGMTVWIVSGTGVGQSRLIVDYVGSTKVATVDPAWATNPSSASVYAVIPSAPAPTGAAYVEPANVTVWNGTAVATPATAGYPAVTIKSGTGTGEINLSAGNLAGSVAGVAGNVTGNVNGTVARVVGNVGGDIEGDVGGSVNNVVGAVGSVTGNVGGNVVGSVASVTAKTGFSLAATGLDLITASDPGGVATTFPQMVVQTWRRFFKKTTKTTTQVKTLADDGTTVRTTQAITDDGAGNQTLGAAT